MTERKISEVILEMEKEIKQIKDYIKSVDFLLKNILSKNPTFNVGSIEKTVLESDSFPISSSGRVVEQTILYADTEKPVIMAKVEISKDTKIVHKSETTPQGKWITKLAPGQYKVSVQKHATANKPATQLSYNIDISASKDPLKLTTIKV